jgi:outer membrane receptor protein involved in Fe transport
MFRLLCFCLFLASAEFLAAQTTVTGTVTNADGGAPLIGVSILEKGTSNGVATESDGTFSINVAGSSAILVVSYVGKLSQEIALNGQTSLNIVLEDDVTTFSDVVVSASRNAVRKLETVTAVEVIGTKQLQRTKPESFAEAVNSAPGMFTNTSQGRRGGVITRGFPDGSPTGGLIYTGVMLDGIPTLGTPGKLPDGGFGFDLNIDRVEVVRGSAATLFGRAAAAGAINVITRTGGAEHHGTARMTYYNDILGTNNFNYRADLNLNGPLSKNVRYNIGGWYLKDDGFRDTGFPDKGGQIRANVDFLFPNNKGELRLYGMASDFNFQNLTDVAVDPNTLKLAPGWKNTDTYQDPARMRNINFLVFESSTRRYVPGPNGQNIRRNLGDAMAGGSYGRGGHAGARLRLDLGGGFGLENHFRYQKLESGVKYGFALPSFYAKTNVLRLYLDGDAVDTDIINELRISKTIEGANSRHNLSAGVYLSTMHLLPTTYSYLHNSTTDPNNIVISGIFPVTAPAPTTGSITRRGDYTEDVFAIFAGDEMKFNDKLTVIAGVRFDMLNMDMEETKIPFDRVLSRKEDFSDWSASIGANYLLNKRTALYGNVNRAFRMPDYSAFTSLELRTDGKFLRLPDGLSANEVIFNTELGFRTSVGDLSFDVAGFYTNIDNRLASIFENGLLVSKPLGQNQIKGTEISIMYAPKWLKGLFLRSALTFQDGRFADFEIPVSTTTAAGRTTLNVNPAGELYGNTLIKKTDLQYEIDLKGKRIPGVPNLIWNFQANYEHKYFGIDFSSNFNGGRFGDATNILPLGDLSIVNAGAYLRLPSKGGNDLRLGVQAKNLFNSETLQGIAGIADNDTVLVQKQRSATFATLPYAQGYVQLPRRFLATLTYSF